MFEYSIGRTQDSPLREIIVAENCHDQNSGIHHRRSIHLQKYDYSSAGTFFVTVCVQVLEYLFVEVVNGIMKLNYAWRVVEKAWHELTERFSNVRTDEFVAMLSHLQCWMRVGANLVFAMN